MAACNVGTGLVEKYGGTHAYGEAYWTCTVPTPSFETKIYVSLQRYRGLGYWQTLRTSNFTKTGSFSGTFGVIESCQGSGLHSYRIQTGGHSFGGGYEVYGADTRFEC